MAQTKTDSQGQTLVVGQKVAFLDRYNHVVPGRILDIDRYHIYINNSDSNVIDDLAFDGNQILILEQSDIIDNSKVINISLVTDNEFAIAA